MKTQTFGDAPLPFTSCRCRPRMRTTSARLRRCGRHDGVRHAWADYRSKRENGSVSDNPNWTFPGDGKITWVKGKVKGDYVCGVKERDGYYHYEVRYDEGPGDKKWMEEKDRNYLARLYLLGPKNDTERKDLEENKQRAKEAAQEIRKLSLDEAPQVLKEFIKNEKQKEAQRKEALRREEKIKRKQEEARKKEELEKKRLEEEQRRKIEQERQRKQQQEELKKAEKLENADKLYEKGNAFHSQRQYQEAILYYNEALKIDPNHVLAKKIKQLALKALENKEIPVDPILPKSNKGSVSTIDNSSVDLSYIISYKDLTVEKQHVLGQGAFGIVYKGTWQCSTVAIKQLHMLKMTEESLQEFKREAQIMSQLTHPNLIRLYGVCLKPPYSMVTEFMANKSLYDYIHSTQSLSWTKIWTISYNIGAGILHLHEKNILHRDLKSLNVLLDERYVAKVCDFGLSKLRQETRTTTKIPQTSQSVGTVQWMAPELFKRGAKYTSKSDVYSYGMILWELITGKVPWKDAVDQTIIITWVKEGEKEIIPDKCPKSYAELISKCWETKPQDRPTIKEALQILKDNQQKIVQFK